MGSLGWKRRRAVAEVSRRRQRDDATSHTCTLRTPPRFGDALGLDAHRSNARVVMLVPDERADAPVPLAKRPRFSPPKGPVHGVRQHVRSSRRSTPVMVSVRARRVMDGPRVVFAAPGDADVEHLEVVVESADKPAKEASAENAPRPSREVWCGRSPRALRGDPIRARGGVVGGGDDERRRRRSRAARVDETGRVPSSASPARRRCKVKRIVLSTSRGSRRPRSSGGPDGVFVSLKHHVVLRGDRAGRGRMSGVGGRREGARARGG